MDIAVIGLPQSGKTTVFNALTRVQSGPSGGGERHVVVVKVADPRVDILSEMYQRLQRLSGIC